MPVATLPTTPSTPAAPAGDYHYYAWDLCDLDAAGAQFTSYPAVEIELRTPQGTLVHTIGGLDTIVRQNSFAQRSQTVDLTLHNMVDLIHPNGQKPVHTLYRLIVREGYRGAMEQVFSGYVTKADFSNAPQEIYISAADQLFFTQKFYILTPLTYYGWAPEDAVRDLLGRCGIPSGQVNIHVDGNQSFYMPYLPAEDAQNGVTGAQLGYQTAESALSHICEMYGYRFWCDLQGYIEVQYHRPFPDQTATTIPVLAPPGGLAKVLRALSAPDARDFYSDSSLAGNLLKVISHPLSLDDFRNFVGVTDGQNAPYYYSQSPTIAGFPAPVAPYPVPPRLMPGEGAPEIAAAAAAVAATHNSALLGYFTSAALVATDVISWGASVAVDPYNQGGATLPMQEWLAQRMVADLNRETESAEVLVVGSPYYDVGQTIYLGDAKSQLSGLFLIDGFQTRMSANGYTSQLKCLGGPTQAGKPPKPRPRHTTHKRHDGLTHATVAHKAGYTRGGNAGTFTHTPASAGGAP